MGTRLQTLATEIENARKTNPAVPAKPETVQAKVDEAQALEIKIKRTQEDAKTRLEKREAALLEPVMAEIMKAPRRVCEAERLCADSGCREA